MNLETVLALHPHSKAFWDGTANGKLLLPLCLDCNKLHWYPRPFCPHCYSFNLKWRESSGKGTIYTSSIMRRAASLYIVAAVQLEDGPTILTNIVADDIDAAKIGASVKVDFDKLNNQDRYMPVFRPE